MSKNTGCPRCDELPDNVYCSICLSKKYGELEKRSKRQAKARKYVRQLKPLASDGQLVMVLICPNSHRWESPADFTAKGDPFSIPRCPEPDCGLFWKEHNRIVLGEFSDAACTERCWKAKDYICKCSCGGAKHGIMRSAA